MDGYPYWLLPGVGLWFRSRAEAKVVIERWRCHYNETRPHSSRGYHQRNPDGSSPRQHPEARATKPHRPPAA